MITVRFPTGFSIQYNTAMHIRNRNADYCDLFTGSGEDDKFVAQIPTACVVEYITPCRLYNPITPSPDLIQREVIALSKEIRSLKRKLGVKP